MHFPNKVSLVYLAYENQLCTQIRREVNTCNEFFIVLGPASRLGGLYRVLLHDGMAFMIINEAEPV
jgi:hypothetical protein